GHADRTGSWRHSPDRAARIVARHRRPSPHRLWRGGSTGRAVYARRPSAGFPYRYAPLVFPGSKGRGSSVSVAGQANLAPDMTGDVLFRARSLCKNFGGVRAVRDVSFDVAQGIVFAVIGPNGAGKSTLLNLISGI